MKIWVFLKTNFLSDGPHNFNSLGSLLGIVWTPKKHIYTLLVENARKFRESAPNQIPIFGKPPPRVGVSENVWFFKFERVDRANVRSKEQIYIRGDFGFIDCSV